MVITDLAVQHLTMLDFNQLTNFRFSLVYLYIHTTHSRLTPCLMFNHLMFSYLFFQTCLRHKMAIDGGDSCRGEIIDKIRLGLYKYFRFSETKNQNTLISLGFNKNRCHKWK